MRGRVEIFRDGNVFYVALCKQRMMGASQLLVEDG